MILVLRLGHRRERDKRITTHCGLVARAFGADGIVLSGERDEKVLGTLRDVVERWGGPFSVSYERNWKGFLKEKKREGFEVVHLTMYGLPFKQRLGELKGKDLVVVVGSEKVPPDLYEMADYNLAIGNQPHSEVAALAVFLYELNGVREEFKGWKMKVIPSERGKEVRKR
ncbi:MAG TPA: tRNA (cytidine(56)-2'-O)-methyltransferase [Candidatus Aenigmarchaeota archaeon]|nr:tRNA (cytidine(56)-2'-O)-methyltransferase [Candidatus Aenigmarchaeota archaeon]